MHAVQRCRKRGIVYGDESMHGCVYTCVCVYMHVWDAREGGCSCCRMKKT